MQIFTREPLLEIVTVHSHIEFHFLNVYVLRQDSPFYGVHVTFDRQVALFHLIERSARVADCSPLTQTFVIFVAEGVQLSRHKQTHWIEWYIACTAAKSRQSRFQEFKF